MNKVGTSLEDYPEGFPLGQWIKNQRVGCTDPERRKKLEKLPGWVWNVDDEKWNRAAVKRANSCLATTARRP